MSLTCDSSACAAARRSSRAGLAPGGAPVRPLGVAGTGALGWYAADSLRHRREGAFGYEIETEIDVGSEEFLRAAGGPHRRTDLDRE